MEEENRGFRMTKETQYIRFGQDCQEMAERTSNDSQRIMLLHIAETWQRLANSVGSENEMPPTRVLH